MTTIDMSKLFTEEVNKYIADGFVIYPYYMRSSWSDIDSKVDLIKGNTLVRVFIKRGRINSFLNSYEIHTGIIYNYKERDVYDDPSTHQFRTTLIHKYAIIQRRNTPWYVPVSEVDAITSKKRARYEINNGFDAERMTYESLHPQCFKYITAKYIVKRYMRRNNIPVPKDDSKIGDVIKAIYHDGSIHYCFCVYYRGKYTKYTFK